MKKFSLHRIAVALVMTLLLPMALQAQRMLDVHNETFDSELHKPASLIDEDRVWKYIQNYNKDFIDERKLEINICFEGTKELDGVEYHVCKAWSGNVCPIPEDKATIAYMREEDGKVYMRYPENFNMKDIIDVYNVAITPSPMCGFNSLALLKGREECETLIYDFNLKRNESYYVLPEDMQPNTRVEVVADFQHPYDNVNYDLQILINRNMENFDNVRVKDNEIPQVMLDMPHWVYNIYNIGAHLGLLPFPGEQITWMSYEPHVLVGIYDREGNLLLNPLKIVESAMQRVEDKVNEYIASVEDIDSDRVVTTEYFDLNGNKIVSPQKGICIKTERHSNGTVKTSKVVL